MKKRKNNPLTKVGEAFSIDAETGEAVPMEGGGLRMLPPATNKCQWCAVEHSPGEPHNQQSLYYQMKFKAVHGRYPTWSDAMAHCTPKLQALWKQELIKIMEKKGVSIPDDLLENQ
jgi:hypothetical protein